MSEGTEHKDPTAPSPGATRIPKSARFIDTPPERRQARGTDDQAAPLRPGPASAEASTLRIRRLHAG